MPAETKIGFLEEAPGVQSLVRLILLLAFVICGAVPTLLWCVLSTISFFRTGAMLEFNGAAAAFFGGVITAACTAKVVQAWKAEQPISEAGVEK